LVANAKAVITAEAAGDPRFARYALELAEGVLDAVAAAESTSSEESA
jgi:hypothetical protein